jgi:hypothetical protein
MTLTAYLQHFIGALHRDYEELLRSLSEEQLYFRPGPTTNHTAFTAWHWLRTEDNVVQYVLQRHPTVWLAEQLNEHWHLPKAAQGTGMPPDEAYALRVPSAGALLDYGRAVWAATDTYLNQVTPAELERVTVVQPLGEMSVLQALGQTLIAHWNQHLGELWVLRDLERGRA